MNDDTIDDLKQFIVATMSQQTVELREGINRLDNKIDRVEKNLTAKIDDLSTQIAEAIDSSNDATDQQLQDHETRITKLETTAA